MVKNEILNNRKYDVTCILSSASKMLYHAAKHANNPQELLFDDQELAKRSTSFTLWEHICIVILHFLNQAKVTCPPKNFDGYVESASFSHSSIAATAYIYCHVTNIQAETLTYRHQLVELSRYTAFIIYWCPQKGCFRISNYLVYT